MPSTRRSLLTAFLTLPLIDAARMRAFAQAAPELPLTASCDDGDDLTLEREAGPFFRPNSPLKLLERVPTLPTIRLGMKLFLLKRWFARASCKMPCGTRWISRTLFGASRKSG